MYSPNIANEYDTVGGITVSCNDAGNLAEYHRSGNPIVPEIRMTIPAKLNFLVVLIILVATWLPLKAEETGPQKAFAAIDSFNQLLTSSSTELSRLDIGRVNLLCAQGLKGSENLDVNSCLTTLDEWAKLIEADTASRIQSYYDNPERYDNSVSLFKIVNMVLTLKNAIGVDYDQDIMQNSDFHDSRDFFLHGCLNGEMKGGCISIPTLCVTVGRRLRYPLKLVLTREHVFFRWDDGTEVFNVEACCPGCDTHPDEHYKDWPNKLTDIDVKMNGYLRSLTPEEELGLFLETRGHCLYDDGRIDEALVCYARAYELMPDSFSRIANVHKAMDYKLKEFQRKYQELAAKLVVEEQSDE